MHHEDLHRKIIRLERILEGSVLIVKLFRACGLYNR
jgi:hypothetical protein